MEKSIAIQTKGLTKRYKEKVAVDHLNLTVYEGEMLAFLGVNGAGKTTTIRMLSGLSVPTEGTAQILGYDVIKEKDQVKALIAAKLYELEEKYEESFVRISKSELVNVKKIKSLDLSLTGTIKVIMKNGYETYSSRRNVAKIRERLALKKTTRG